MDMSADQKPGDNARGITILGSTGSIGCNTIDLIERNPELYRVEALTAQRSVELLAEQARKTNAGLAVVADEECYLDLKKELAGTGTAVAAGREALIEAAARPADWVMAAIVGAAGLEPTLAAIRRGAVIALANKECLVCAGDLMLAEIGGSGATLLPVDSEHNAIFQVFDFKRPEAVEKIILTASGGPFWNSSVEEMKAATPAKAVAHPNWSMGAKISVDSATMMNKGLELIEAHYLFRMEEERVDVLVHPESIIHSLVAYLDGSVLAQLGSPDMRTPIAFALGWPDRIAAPSSRLNLPELAKLTFFEPDSARFPSIDLARQALRNGGAAATVLNASNEVAVQAFLEGKTGFLDIFRIVSDTMDKMGVRKISCLEDVYETDAEARRVAGELSLACAANL